MKHYLRTRTQYTNAPRGTIVVDDELWVKISDVGWTAHHDESTPWDPAYRGSEIDGTKRLVLFWGCNVCSGTMLDGDDLCMCTPLLTDDDFAAIYGEIEGAR